MLDHHDDIVSDLRALHGIVDWRALPGRELWPLVERLLFYPGALRGYVLATASQGTGEDPEGTSPERGEALIQQLADQGWAEVDREG